MKTLTLAALLTLAVLAQDAPPAAPPPAPPLAAQPIKVGAGTLSGLATKRVAAVYPVEARKQRVQGVVMLDARIGKDGLIKELKNATGPALLIEGAIAAVQQWEYRPYLLNGEPVEVETQIEINFRLN